MYEINAEILSFAKDRRRVLDDATEGTFKKL